MTPWYACGSYNLAFYLVWDRVSCCLLLCMWESVSNLETRKLIIGADVCRITSVINAHSQVYGATTAFCSFQGYFLWEGWYVHMTDLYHWDQLLGTRTQAITLVWSDCPSFFVSFSCFYYSVGLMLDYEVSPPKPCVEGLVPNAVEFRGGLFEVLVHKGLWLNQWVNPMMIPVLTAFLGGGSWLDDADHRWHARHFLFLLSRLSGHWATGSCLREVPVLSQARRNGSSQPWTLEAMSQRKPFLFEGVLVECFATVMGDSEWHKSNRCFHWRLCGSWVSVITIQLCYVAQKDFISN